MYHHPVAKGTASLCSHPMGVESDVGEVTPPVILFALENRQPSERVVATGERNDGKHGAGYKASSVTSVMPVMASLGGRAMYVQHRVRKICVGRSFGLARSASAKYLAPLAQSLRR